jgi:hypothetical protein
MIPAMTRLVAPLLFATVVLAGCGDPDRSVPLGARRMLGYHVRAGAASEVPAGDIGYLVTANGLGGYRLAWVAFAGSTHVFSGRIESDSTFDPRSIVGYSGREQITLTADNLAIDFSSVPDAAADGVDFVPTVDPIYVDLRVDGVPANVYFTGAETSRLYLSAYNPVAFTSP